MIEKVQGMIGGREQIHNDSEDDRTKEIKTISEVEAYQKIEDEFGFYPVELLYLPDGMVFKELFITETTNNADMCYVGDNEESIVYSIYPNFRTGSIGQDVEDDLTNKYEKVVQDVTISIKKYSIEGNQLSRYKVSFEYQNVYYFLEINNLEEQEVEKIVENLYFN